MSSPPPSSSSSPLIAVVDIPEMGKGVVAQKDIPRGTRILSEPPLFEITNTQLVCLELPSVVKSFPPSLRDVFLSYPTTELSRDPIQSRAIHLIPRLDQDGRKTAHGLFEIICRLNHSCSPNAHWSWNEDLKQRVLYSTELIPSSSQIFASYTELDPFARRQTLLKRQFDFKCRCDLCQLPSQEQQALDVKIVEVNKFVKDLPSLLAYGNPRQVLVDVVRICEITVEEKSLGHRLSSLAHDAFNVCCWFYDETNAKAWGTVWRESSKIMRGPNPLVQSQSTQPSTHPAWGARKVGKSDMVGPSAKLLAFVKDPSKLSAGQKKAAKQKRKKAEALSAAPVPPA